jgi:hypothetical protein
MACMDRVILLDIDNRKTESMMTWEELREYGIRWYANRKG